MAEESAQAPKKCFELAMSRWTQADQYALDALLEEGMCEPAGWRASQKQIGRHPPSLPR